MMSTSTEQARVFIGPGLSPFKRIMTMVGVFGVTLLVLWIAIHQGLSAVGSTVAALIFITGFIIYLRIVAPVPFMISLSSEGVAKKSRNGDVIELNWNEITRIKEEFFRNGKRISLAVYRRPGELQQKARAWVVYRDDVKDIDELALALQEMKPMNCEWSRETVHD